MRRACVFGFCVRGRFVAVWHARLRYGSVQGCCCWRGTAVLLHCGTRSCIEDIKLWVAATLSGAIQVGKQVAFSFLFASLRAGTLDACLFDSFLRLYLSHPSPFFSSVACLLLSFRSFSYLKSIWLGCHKLPVSCFEDGY